MFSTPARVPTIEGRVMGCRTWTKVRPIAAASVRADDSVGFIFIASLMLHVLSRRKIPPPPGKSTPVYSLPTSLLYDRAARDEEKKRTAASQF